MASNVARLKEPDDLAAIESALLDGDLSKLSVAQRLQLYKRTCESVGLNSLTQPFQYIKFEGRLQLYCKRDATEQLRKIHGVSVKLVDARSVDAMYVVKAQAQDKSGRFDESTGAVSLIGLRGKELANAWMRCESKAKRRVTLSICGLGWLDESEAGDVEGAEFVAGPVPTAEDALPATAPTEPVTDPGPVNEPPAPEPEAPLDDWELWVTDRMEIMDGIEKLSDLQADWSAWAEPIRSLKHDRPDLYVKLVNHKDQRKSDIAALHGIG